MVSTIYVAIFRKVFSHSSSLESSKLNFAKLTYCSLVTSLFSNQPQILLLTTVNFHLYFIVFSGLLEDSNSTTVHLNRMNKTMMKLAE